MKRLVLMTLAALIGLGSLSYGQEDPDTSKIRIGKKKYTVIIDDDKEIRIITDGDTEVVTRDIPERKPVRRHVRKMDGNWGGLEFGLTNFVNSDYQLELPAGAEFMEVKMANAGASTLISQRNHSVSYVTTLAWSPDLGWDTIAICSSMICH